MDVRPDDPDAPACDTVKLAYYLTKARNVLAQRLEIAVKPLGLTAQQVGVILILAKGVARTPLELARYMAIDSGSVTRMLDRLESKGFVTRSRSDADRRVVELALTERGLAAAGELPSLRTVVLDAQLQGFTSLETRLLTELLARFAANGIGQTSEAEFDANGVGD
jgi:DNA-binding MarR family transcriptional regulator